MSDATRRSLRDLIRDRYDYLLSRLSYRLGSKDLAGDALHDAFLRLERAELADEVKQPTSYILRMATNIASNRRRDGGRLLSVEDVAEALRIPDEAQDPSAPIERQSDLAAVKRALQKLPERHRTLLIAVWLDETPTAELARLHGLPLRTVQREVKEALDEIRERLAAPNVIPLRPVDRQVS
jgi:RNA polymerase sigma factor (sigma-70 family)